MVKEKHFGFEITACSTLCVEEFAHEIAWEIQHGNMPGVVHVDCATWHKNMILKGLCPNCGEALNANNTTVKEC